MRFKKVSEMQCFVDEYTPNLLIMTVNRDIRGKIIQKKQLFFAIILQKTELIILDNFQD